MMTECASTLCPLGSACKNKFLAQSRAAGRRWEADRFSVRHAEGMGRCLYSKVAFSSGDIVIDYRGLWQTKDESKPIRQERSDRGETSYYLMSPAGISCTVDASATGNYARFAQHSCNPNCETQVWWERSDALHVVLIALRDIDVDEPITFRYNWYGSGMPRIACLCGAGDDCSGYVGMTKTQVRSDHIRSLLATGAKF